MPQEIMSVQAGEGETRQVVVGTHIFDLANTPEILRQARLRLGLIRLVERYGSLEFLDELLLPADMPGPHTKLIRVSDQTTLVVDEQGHLLPHIPAEVEWLFNQLLLS
jgi:hypothetical protein